MARVNFNDGFPYTRDRYIQKYGRAPKQWTIDSLHELWLKSKERYDQRNRDIWQYVEEITKVIPKNHRDEHLVYYTQKEQIRAYVIRYESTFRGPSIGHQDMKFETREDRLEFLLTTELNFEMGQELKRRRDLETRLHWLVFEVLWEKVEESLRQKFKNQRPENAFVMEIGGKKYIIKTEDRYGSYYKFKLECEYNEVLIEI